MPALNFKTKFAPAILAGKKPFTLREPRKDGRDPKLGEPLYLFTAMRTKQCRKFAEKPCRFAVTISLGWREVTIGGLKTLREWKELDTFSQLDGFKNYAEFCLFHQVKFGMTDKPMKLIAWVTKQELIQLLSA